jgi:dolichyl-phosphate beta-glucosyltransferase
VIRDTQAGFKLYRAEVARLVFERTLVRSFAYDVEALFIARKLGARIVQMPVECEFRPESTYDVRRHLPPFLGDVVRIRRNSLRGLYG